MEFSKAELSKRMNNYLFSKKEAGTYLHSYDNGEVIAITEPLDCRLRKCEVWCTCRDDGMVIRAICPVKATADSYGAICRAFVEWNKVNVGPIFDLDFKNGTISVKQYYRLSTLTAFSEVFVSALSWPVQALQAHADEIIRLLE